MAPKLRRSALDTITISSRNDVRRALICAADRIFFPKQAGDGGVQSRRHARLEPAVGDVPGAPAWIYAGRAQERVMPTKMM